MSTARRVAERFKAATRLKFYLRPGDEDVMLDLSELNDSNKPVSLADFIRDNASQDVATPQAEEIAALRKLRPGQEAYVGIGGGAVKVKRVH
jgi:hypothetical protein